MDEDTILNGCVGLLLVVFLSTLGYGSYRLGVITERKAYTANFIEQVQAAYWEGYTDALTGMRKHK